MMVTLTLEMLTKLLNRTKLLVSLLVMRIMLMSHLALVVKI